MTLPLVPAIRFCGPGDLYLARTPSFADIRVEYQMVSRDSQCQVTFAIHNDFATRRALVAYAGQLGNNLLLHEYANQIRDAWRTRQCLTTRHRT
jgi:hypothetical protein